MTNNQYTNFIKKTIKARKQERTELTNDIPRMQGEIAQLESRVEAGQRDGGWQAGPLPHAAPAANTALEKAQGELERLTERVGEIDRELAVLKVQSEAEGVKARCMAQVADFDGQIAQRQQEIEVLQAKAAELETQRAAEAAAAEAAALAGGNEKDAGSREHAHKADILAHAVSHLHTKVSEQQERIAALRAQRTTVKDEAGAAEMHAAQADWEWCAREQLMHRFHRLCSAHRRLYGWGGFTTPDLDRMHTDWLQAQDAQD